MFIRKTGWTGSSSTGALVAAGSLQPCFPTYLPSYEFYFIQNWLPRWNEILTLLRFIHNWAITGIQCMVGSWVLGFNVAELSGELALVKRSALDWLLACLSSSIVGSISTPKKVGRLCGNRMCGGMCRFIGVSCQKVCGAGGYKSRTDEWKGHLIWF
jgi:hypothetical protein